MLLVQASHTTKLSQVAEALLHSFFRFGVKVEEDRFDAAGEIAGEPGGSFAGNGVRSCVSLLCIETVLKILEKPVPGMVALATSHRLAH